MTNQYFDFHLHPLFKNHLTEFDEALPMRPRELDELTSGIKFSNDLANLLDDIFLHILKSQSSINQLREPAGILCCSIANLEFGFADSSGFFSKILKSNFTNPIDKTFFDKVRNGQVSYYRLMLMELELYKQLCRTKTQSKKTFKFVSRNSKEGKIDDSCVNFLFNLEGAHNFSKFKVGRNTELDLIHFDKEPGDTWAALSAKNNGSAITNPAKALEELYQNLAKEGLDLFYLTLTHLTHINEQHLATHAFGMKMLKHPTFYPYGNGLSNLGKELIEQCYSRKTNGKQQPIVIDLKHLGLKSRQDLYELRQKSNYSKIPLIASHVAVTGYSINEWKDALQTDSCMLYNGESVRAVSITTTRKQCGKWGSFINNDFSFNPWTINLMDEDIVEVIKSNGIIGLTLDVRVLGFQSEYGLKLVDDNEFLSTADFQTHFPQIGIKTLPVKNMESMVVDTESWLVPTKEERHPLAFCFNIIHIIKTAQLKADSPEPWKQICIGSDYDGLIEPLKVSPNVGSITELRANMIRWLPVALKAYTEENGGNGSFKQKLSGKNVEVSEIVDDILFRNGKKFVERWLNNFGLNGKAS